MKQRVGSFSKYLREVVEYFETFFETRELESFYCFTVWIKYSRIRTEDSGKLIRDIENNFTAE